MHDALNILDHHNRVIDQQTDGQHHAEHGQHVDRKPGHRHDTEGAEQHHRHGQRRNQGCAQVLQEQQHDQKDQQHSLEQSLVDLMDGGADKRCGVVGETHLNPFGEVGFQLGDALAHTQGGVQRIGPRRQIDPHAGRRLAGIVGLDAVVLGAQLHPGNVAEGHARAIAVGLDQNAAELLCGFQAGLRRDGGIELLPWYRRQTTQLADRDLSVLHFNGRDHIAHGELVLGQPGGIKPDAHGVLSTEQLSGANAGHTSDRILQIGGDEISQVGAVEATVG